MLVAAKHGGRVNSHEVVRCYCLIHVVGLAYNRYVLPFLGRDQLKQIVATCLPFLLLEEQVVRAGDLVVLVVLHKLLVLLGRVRDHLASLGVSGWCKTTVESEVVQLAKNVRKHRDGIFPDDDAFQF